MRQDVSIRIKGVYDTGDGTDEVELYTDGKMYQKNSHTFVTYEESETTGFEGCRTMLKIEEDMVTMTRRGKGAYSHLVMQRGVRNIGRYQLYGEPMDIGVYTDRMDIDLTPEGGKLHISYTLDMNSSLLSENELFVDIRKAAGIQQNVI